MLMEMVEMMWRAGSCGMWEGAWVGGGWVGRRAGGWVGGRAGGPGEKKVLIPELNSFNSVNFEGWGVKIKEFTEFSCTSSN